MPTPEQQNPQEMTAAAPSEAEMLYQRLLDLSLEGLLRVDASDRITYANARMAEMVGWAPGDLEGRSVYDLLFPEDAEPARARRTARSRGDREQYEARLRRKDGAECWVIAGVSVLESGGAYAGTFSLMTDITERRRAEEALRRNEQDLQLAIGAARLGTFYCEWPLDKIVWNETCLEHFFLPLGAEVDFALFYSLLHPDDRAPTRAAIERAVAERVEYNVEYRTLAPDGRTRWVNAVGRVYYDDGRRPGPVRRDHHGHHGAEGRGAGSCRLSWSAKSWSTGSAGPSGPPRSRRPSSRVAWTLLGAALDVDHCYFVTYDIAGGRGQGRTGVAPGRAGHAGRRIRLLRPTATTRTRTIWPARTYVVEDADALPGERGGQPRRPGPPARPRPGAAVARPRT